MPAQSLPDANVPDEVETLAEAILKATGAQQWDAVEALTAELWVR